VISEHGKGLDLFLDLELWTSSRLSEQRSGSQRLFGHNSACKACVTVGLRYRLGLYKRAARVATHLVICRERLLVVLPDGSCFTAPVQ
jgi:hypothetical protein